MWGLAISFIYFFTKIQKSDRKLNCYNETKNAQCMLNFNCCYEKIIAIIYRKYYCWWTFRNIRTLINI